MFGTDEPLVRNAQMAANNRQRRRQSMPIGGGIARTIGIPDSLESQAAMDEMQDSVVSEPAGSGPIRLASMQQRDGGGPPPGSIMTAQFRQSGGTSAPVRTTGNCRNGQCGLPSAGLGMTNPYNLGPGEVVTAIDGVPVGGGMPMMSSGMPSPPASAPMSGVPVSGPPSAAMPATGQDLIAQGDQLLREGASVFPADPAAYANRTVPGRAFTQAGLNMIQQAPALAVAEREMTEAELNGAMERETQRQNLAMAYANSTVGTAEDLDAMITGTGKFAGKSAETRAQVATMLALQRYNGEHAMQKFDAKAWQSWVEGKIAGYDIGRLIANQGEITDGDWSLATGNQQDIMPSVKQTVMNRYYGKRDGTTPRVLVGDNLRNVMHQELDQPISYAIAARLRKDNPEAPDDAIESAALADAYDVVERLHGPMDYANSQHVDQQGGWYATQEALGRGLRALLDTTVPAADPNAATKPAMKN